MAGLDELDGMGCDGWDVMNRMNERMGWDGMGWDG